MAAAEGADIADQALIVVAQLVEAWTAVPQAAVVTMASMAALAVVAVIVAASTAATAMTIAWAAAV